MAEIELVCNQPDNGQGVIKFPFDVRESLGFITQCFTLWTKYPLYILFACTLDMSQAFGGYGVTNLMSIALLPLVMDENSIPLFYTISSLGTFPGIAIAALLIDRIGRKRLLPIGYSLCCVAVYLLYLAFQSRSKEHTFAAGFIYNIFYSMAWGTGYSMYSEIFPTHIRSTGIGMAVAVGRIGGLVAPLATTWIYSNSKDDGQNVGGALLLVVACFSLTVFAAIPWSIYGTEGMGLSLEDASREGVNVELQEL